MVSTNSSYCVGNTWGGSKKTGQCVKDIQRILNGVGGTYSVGTADGAYGSKTLAGVKNFQRFWGLSPVDGVVGAKTWERLCYVAYYNGVDSTNAANNAGCKGASGAYVVGSGSGTTPATYAWYTIGSENASGSSIILQIADNYQRSTGGGWQFQKVTLQPGYRYRVCANISGNGTFRFGSNGVIRSVKSSSGKLMYCGAEYEVLRATQYAGKYSITLVSGYINVYDVWLQQYRIQK